jgi:hypothetical protein
VDTEIEIASTDLEEAAYHIFSGFPAEYANPPATIDDTIRARIEITGDTTASLSVEAETHAASALAIAFFGINGDELVEEDLNDAVKECANVIAGTLKPLLRGVTTLGIPEQNGEQITETTAVVNYAGGNLNLGFVLHSVEASV